MTSQERTERPPVPRAVFDNLRGAIVLYEEVDGGSDFLVADINDAAAAINERPADFLRGKLMSEVFPAALEPGSVADILRKALSTGTDQDMGLIHYVDDRNDVWVSGRAVPLGSGLVHASFLDMTDRIQREELEEAVGRLRASDDEIERLVAHSGAAIIVCSPDGAALEWNSNLVQFLGWPIETVDEVLSHWVLWEDPQLMSSASVRQRAVEVLEGTTVTTDPTLLDPAVTARRFAHMDLPSLPTWVRPRYVPIPGEDGSVDRLAVILDDISEIMGARASLSRAALLMELTSEAVVITDVDGSIVEANAACSALIGTPSDELLGRDVRSLFSERHDEDFHRNVLVALEVNGRWRGDSWITTADGEQRSVMSVATVEDALGDSVGCVIVFSDRPGS